MESFTTESSGIKYGLVKNHGKSNLQKVKSLIENLPMRDHRYAVHVFRNVIEPCSEVLQWTQEHAASFAEDVLELSLQSVEDCRLYEKCKITVGEQHNTKPKKGKRKDSIGRQILQHFNGNVGDINLEEVPNSVGDERRAIVSRMEQFFTHATQNNAKYWYIYNCENPPHGIESCLNGISGHLDPTKNSRIEEMPGINTSMFYVGSAGSFTEMHVEDSLADSVNIIHAGKQKIWMIIDREDYARTNEIITEKLKEVSHVVNDTESGGITEVCVLPLQHKNLVLTPRLLDEHNIRYEFVVQNAGDLVYVRYGILHQVVNVGVNVAEAINVGSNAWNYSNELKMLCPCDKCQLVHAPTNTDVYMAAKVGKVKTRTHICDTCGKSFATKMLHAKHQKDDHRTSTSHVCEICDKIFKHAQSLNRHVRLTHPTVQRDEIRQSFCDVCNKGVVDIVRHKRERHQQLVECFKCKADYTRHDLAEHQKICVKFSCTDCGKEFKSRASLATHCARWCNPGTRLSMSKKRKVNEENATDDGSSSIRSVLFSRASESNTVSSEATCPDS